jgi:hypothetical protein
MLMGQPSFKCLGDRWQPSCKFFIGVKGHWQSLKNFVQGVRRYVLATLWQGPQRVLASLLVAHTYLSEVFEHPLIF